MKRRYIAIPLTTLVVVMAVVAQHWANSPAVSKSALPQKETAVKGAAEATNPFMTSYFSTRIPSTVRVLRTEERAGSAVVGEYQIVSTNSRQNYQVGISISKLNSDEITNTSPVKFRANNPEYVPATLANMPDGAVAYKKSDGGEIGVFWPAGTHYASVVGSGSADQAANINDLVLAVLENWQWQNP